MALAAKSFSDLITFTRASTAGYYGSDGLYKTAASGVARTGAYADYKPAELTQQNALAYSQQFDQAIWAKAGAVIQTNRLLHSNDWSNAIWSKGTNITLTPAAAIGPDGAMSMSKLEATAAAAAVCYQAAVATATAHTYSIYVKQGSGVLDANYFVLRNATTSTNLAVCYINFSTGAITQSTGSGATATNVGGGIWRVQVPATSGITVGDTLWVYACYSGSVETAGEYAYVYGAQLVEGSVAGDYRATTSAALPCLYTAPDGTLTAMRVVETATTGAHQLLQTLVVQKNLPYAFSLYVKSDGRSFCRFVTNAYSGDVLSGFYNIVDGTKYAPTVAGTASGAVSTVTAADNGWFRLTLAGYTSTATGASIDFSVRGASSSTNETYAGDPALGFYIWGAQMNTGLSALPYLATTATGGHVTTTGAKRGFFVEESRANLVLQSQTFDNASWFKGNSSVTADAATAPDGTTTADKLVENSATSSHSISQSVTTAAATVYTYSVYLKAAERKAAQIRYENSGSTQFFAVNIDLTSGVYYTSSFGSPTSTNLSVESVGNGWWRVSLTAASNNTTWACVVFVQSAFGTTSYLGDGTSGIYVWGAQLEAGENATSYIPTTTSQVTRAVDAASINTLSPWFNAAGGTLYAEFVTAARAPTGNNTRFLEFNDGTATTRILFYASPAASGHGVSMQVRNAGVDQAGLSFVGAYTPNTTIKVAGTFAANNFAFSVNGAAAVTDTSGTLPATFSEFNIGKARSGSTVETLNGWFRVIRHYPRVFSASELQALTA